MIKAHASKSNLFVGIGLVGQLVGNFALVPMGGVAGVLGMLLIGLGAATFVVGCGYYATAKGYHFLLGLLGLLSIVGLIVLVALPDQHPEYRGHHPTVGQAPPQAQAPAPFSPQQQAQAPAPFGPLPTYQAPPAGPPTATPPSPINPPPGSHGGQPSNPPQT